MGKTNTASSVLHHGGRRLYGLPVHVEDDADLDLSGLIMAVISAPELKLMLMSCKEVTGVASILAVSRICTKIALLERAFDKVVAHADPQKQAPLKKPGSYQSEHEALERVSRTRFRGGVRGRSPPSLSRTVEVICTAAGR